VGGLPPSIDLDLARVPFAAPPEWPDEASLALVADALREPCLRFAVWAFTSQGVTMAVETGAVGLGAYLTIFFSGEIFCGIFEEACVVPKGRVPARALPLITILGGT
jgi:hypothetical protein